ncbi:MAG: antitoxin, partial [Deltaproteobacteria bacterium]|nr:antitoxin [Deltaproteobacteria bacterium]
MQVLVEEAELRRMQAAAKARGLTLAEWVRGHLREAVRSTPLGSAQKKLDAVRAAAQHAYPSGEVDQMLEEIERGYGRAE